MAAVWLPAVACALAALEEGDLKAADFDNFPDPLFRRPDLVHLLVPHVISNQLISGPV